jgi:hypothetical protein
MILIVEVKVIMTLIQEVDRRLHHLVLTSNYYLISLNLIMFPNSDVNNTKDSNAPVFWEEFLESYQKFKDVDLMIEGPQLEKDLSYYIVD